MAASNEELLDYLLSVLCSESVSGSPAAGSAGADPAVFKKPYAYKRQLLRRLCNLRPAVPISADFLKAQDELLQRELKDKPLVRVEDTQGQFPLKLYQGDITLIKADAVTNAANAQMLGCFIPGHNCIDNCIHSAAGVQLRLACAEKMLALGRPAQTAEVIVTPGFNLPAKYVFHVTGPIVASVPGPKEISQLELCYVHLIEQALKMGLHSLAVCAISTGVFNFPGELAAQIAVNTAKSYADKLQTADLCMIFNAFDDRTAGFYRKLLGLT